MRKRSAAFGRLLAVTCLAALAAVGAAALAGSAAAVEPVAAPAAVQGPAAAGPAPAAAPQPPIHIEAEAAEYFNKEGRVVFTGNVVANQGDTTLTSQRMEVTFSQPAGGGAGAGAIGDPAAARKITQIVALERVTFRQVDPETKTERFATGEKGVYDAVQRVVTMTGSPRLWEGKNVIVGDEIRMRLDDKNMNVRGKVNLTVYPDEAKEAKQP